jgi:ATP-binding cassette, subfamily C, bacterial
MAKTPGARMLIADLLVFSRRRSAAAITLIVAGAVLEGAGVVMLVPIVSLILDGSGVGGTGGSLIAPVFAALGLETVAARFTVVLAAFGLLLLLRLLVLLYRDDKLTRLQEDFVAALRGRAFRQIARAPWSEVAKMQRGPVGHALTRDVDRATQGVALVVYGGIAVVMLVVQLGLALALAPAVTLIVGLLGLGLFRSLRWLRIRAERQGAELTDTDLALYQGVEGFLSGLKPAKAHGLEGAYVDTIDHSATQVAEQRRAYAFDSTFAQLLMQTSSGAIAIVAILLGLFVLDTPSESLIVTLIILARLYAPLQSIQNSIQGIRYAAPGYRATREIAGPVEVSVTPAEAVPATPLETAPEISLAAVSWHGDDAESLPVLNDVSSRLPAGQVTALIGESGAGKSTFCDLAVGLLAPTSGAVLLDGAILDDALTRRLRASVAYVGQEPFLFEDSLRHNLCWGCGPVDDAEIWQALETVGAGELARGLEGGLDGRIRAEGMRFSGGERQRLRLARALLRRPRFLVLDEATNALDLDAEARILRAMLAARGGATVLMVSHRLGNLRLADHVILLEGGRLAETGPVAALTCDPSSLTGRLLVSGAIRAD